MSTKNFIIPTKTIYNFVNFMWWGVLFLTALLCLMLIIEPNNIIITNISYNIKDAGHIINMENQKISMIIGDAYIEYPEDYTHPLSVLIVSFLSIFLEFALTLFILFQIRQIIKEALTQNPLNYKNSHRLLTIGWAIIGLGLNETVTNFFDYATANYVLSECFANGMGDIENPMNRTPSFGTMFYTMISGTNLLTGLLVIALSTVFKTGALMKEEADLTR